MASAPAALPRRVAVSRDPAFVVPFGGTLAALASLLLVANSEVLADPKLNGLLRAVNILSAVGAGAITWHLRPHNRLGPLLVGIGALFALTTLQGSTSPVAYNAGRLVLPLCWLALLYAFLAFPTGRLDTDIAQLVMVGAGALFAVVWLATALVSEQLPVTGILSECRHTCPANPFNVVAGSKGLADALALAGLLVTASAAWAVDAVLVARTRAASHAQRLTLSAGLVPLTLLALAATVAAVLWAAGRHGAATDVGWAYAPLFVAIPVTFVAAQVRGRLFAGSAVREMLGTLGPHASPRDVEADLARALDDPTLRVAYRARGSDGYVDADGRELALPPGAGVAVIREDGEPVAAILHDPALDDVPGVMATAGAAVLLALRNAQLSADLQASILELRASRARIATAADAARRDLERELAAGAQRRLTSIRAELAEARDAATEDADRALLGALVDHADAAIESVEVTARGIYPPRLAADGVVAALEAEVAACPVPVSLEAAGIPRGRQESETALFYTCAEAVQNAVKHAGRGARVTITLEPAESAVRFAVRDDGHGFDVAARASSRGLTNMRDRIEAAGGELSVLSVPGRGTTVSGLVPW